MTASRQCYRARWIFPGDGEPLADAAIEIEDGRIAGVHHACDAPCVDLGNAAVIPGLVNCHTHLEFSNLAEPTAPARPFTAWIRAVVAARRQMVHAVDAAIGRGLQEAVSTGATTLGEITTSPSWNIAVNLDDAPRVVAFREILGLRPEQTNAQMKLAEEFLALANNSSLVRGLSPHAPYSVHPDLFRRLVDLAVARRGPVALHLAETPAELELLQHGTGEFVEMLTEFGVWRDDAIPPGTRPLDYLRQLARVDHALVVHGNYLDAEEQAFLARHENLSVVYCPRTHAYFGHAPHPWRALLAQGGRVVLGTDSRASNPNLSLWDEVRFLHTQFPDVAPVTLLQMATLDGAQALGLGAETGSLAVGKSADLCIVRLPDAEGDPWSLLLHPDSTIVGTMLAGQSRL